MTRKETIATRRSVNWTLAAAYCLSLLTPSGLLTADEPTGAVRFDPIVRNIEGWTVHVDPELIEGKHRDEGTRALQMLANHLQRIAILVPEDRLTLLRRVENLDRTPTPPSWVRCSIIPAGSGSRIAGTMRD